MPSNSVTFATTPDLHLGIDSSTFPNLQTITRERVQGAHFLGLSTQGWYLVSDSNLLFSNVNKFQKAAHRVKCYNFRMSKNILLIDGHALIYRAYHAFHDLSTKEGVLVNAVYGFSRILLTSIKDFEPEYVLVTFDCAKPTFRHADFVGYKANRAKMPDDLVPQIDLIKKIVTALNLPIFELPGYEADDLIGTLTRQIEDLRISKPKDDESVPDVSVIVTGDRDAFQLVTETTHVWMPGRSPKIPDREYGPPEVVTRMSVRPDQIVDLKALMGDASDNIPGVPGIGEKNAVKLIQEFDTLEKIYESIQIGESEISKHEVMTAKLVAKLANGHEEAILSQQLATIDRNTPITLDLEACRLSSYNKVDVEDLFEEYEFRSLMKLLPADRFEKGVQNALF
ncbi:hypothetical protein BH10PAT2_BH10PAT2_0200 [soil metagenome]